MRQMRQKIFLIQILFSIKPYNYNIKETNLSYVQTTTFLNKNGDANPFYTFNILKFYEISVTKYIFVMTTNQIFRPKNKKCDKRFRQIQNRISVNEKTIEMNNVAPFQFYI